MVYITFINYLRTMKIRSGAHGDPRSGWSIQRSLKRYKVLSALLMIMAIFIGVIAIGVYAEDIGRSSDTAMIGIGVPVSEPQNISEAEVIVEAEPEYESSNESADIKSMEQAEEDRMNSIMIFGSMTLLIATPFIMQAGNHPYFVTRRKLTI